VSLRRVALRENVRTSLALIPRAHTLARHYRLERSGHVPLKIGGRPELHTSTHIDRLRRESL
jgi:hypothetical protein